jgi:hypothetical protein
MLKNTFRRRPGIGSVGENLFAERQKGYQAVSSIKEKARWAF